MTQKPPYPTIEEKRALAGRADLLDLPMTHASSRMQTMPSGGTFERWMMGCYAVTPGGELWAFRCGKGASGGKSLREYEWLAEPVALDEWGDLRGYTVTVDGRRKRYTPVRLVALATLADPPPGHAAVLVDADEPLSPSNVAYASPREIGRRFSKQAHVRKSELVREREVVSIHITQELARRLERQYRDLLERTSLQFVCEQILRDHVRMRPAEDPDIRRKEGARRQASMRAGEMARQDVQTLEIARRLTSEFGHVFQPRAVSTLVKSGRGPSLRDVRATNRKVVEDAKSGLFSASDLASEHGRTAEEVRKILSRHGVSLQAAQEDAVRRMAADGVSVQEIVRRSPLPASVSRSIAASVGTLDG